MKRELYKHIAGRLQAMDNCRKSNNDEWLENHRQMAISLVNEYMPSGSGIDSGMRLEFSDSTAERLVFHFDYHHMQDGYYTHWSSHVMTVTASLVNGINIRITKDGERDSSLFDYLYEVMEYALTQEVDDTDLLNTL